MNQNKKILVNTLVSFFTQIIILVFGFVVPRIILVNYGSDTNGLTNTITQVFTYLALLEGGIGTSAKNILYKPVKENNTSEICHRLSIARNQYSKTTILYLAAVLFMSFLLPFILKTNVNRLSIFLYTLFEGLANVICFYFINTLTCFLVVKGDNYVVNIITLIYKVLWFTSKIVLSLFKLDIAFIQFGSFIFMFVQLLLFRLYVKHKYPWLKYEKINTIEKLPDKNSFIVTEVAWTIFSSTDLIVLSVFVSTSVSSVYAIYSAIFVALNSLLNTLYNSVYYKLGEAFVSNLDSYKKIHDLFNSVFMGAITSLMCSAYMLSLPFIRIYTSGVNDINYIYQWLPLLFCMIQLFSWSRYVSGNLTGIGGYAKGVSRISILEATTNIVLSLLLVNLLGIYGVLIATVVALPLKIIYCNYIADKKIMHRSSFKTIKIFASNYICFGLIVLCTFFIDLRITNYFDFLWKGLIVFVIITIVVVAANFLSNKDIIGLKKVFKRS